MNDASMYFHRIFQVSMKISHFLDDLYLNTNPLVRVCEILGKVVEIKFRSGKTTNVVRHCRHVTRQLKLFSINSISENANLSLPCAQFL